MKVNFIVLKWGTKYGPEYVNRLYRTLLNIYSGEFDFYCFTDDSKNLQKDIIVKDIALLRPPGINCFTVEKIFLFDNVIKGNNVLFDLDILVTKDLYPYLVEYRFAEGRFLLNDWADPLYCEVEAKMGGCYINSSFVTWKDSQLKYVLDFYLKHKKTIEFKYDDLDTFLFQGMRKQLHYHPEKMAISYNFNSNYDEIKDIPILMFNTSHGKNSGIELHQAKDWTAELWRRYD